MSCWEEILDTEGTAISIRDRAVESIINSQSC